MLQTQRCLIGHSPELGLADKEAEAAATAEALVTLARSSLKLKVRSLKARRPAKSGV